MMSRILFWLALVFLVMFAIRSKLRGLQQPPQAPRQPAPPPPDPAAHSAAARRQSALDNAEVMLCCAHCGMYFPASESVRAGGHDFCSPAHAKLPVS